MLTGPCCIIAARCRPTNRRRLDGLQARADKALVNLSLRTVDLDAAIEPADQDLFSSLGNVPLPRLAIQYPPHLKIDRPVWSGPFGDQNLTGLLDSPLRQELLKRLTGGQTAVWLMIDSGDAGQDDRAAAALESELERLDSSLKLPELTDSPEDVIQDGPPLRVEFSLLRVRRDDPAEQALVAMLVNCEPDLPTLVEPLVFPLFGRSRCMLPLVGDGISQDNIQNSARFLAGACSCQVKDLNPGFDLLLTADWNQLLSWAKSPAFASGESPKSATAEPELVPIPGGSRSSPSRGCDGRSHANGGSGSRSEDDRRDWDRLRLNASDPARLAKHPVFTRRAVADACGRERPGGATAASRGRKLHPRPDGTAPVLADAAAFTSNKRPGLLPLIPRLPESPRSHSAPACPALPAGRSQGLAPRGHA